MTMDTRPSPSQTMPAQTEPGTPAGGAARGPGLSEQTDPRYTGGFLNFSDLLIHHVTSHHQRRIEVIETGQGDPVVLLPGYSLATVWRAQFVDLARNHRVIALHYPGAGHSEPHPECHSLDELVRVMVSSIEALKLERPAHVVGWSMGCFVAIAMAAQYPDLVRSLCLVNGCAYADRTRVSFGDMAEDFMTHWSQRASEWPGFAYEHIKDGKGLKPMREQYETIIDLRAEARRVLAPTTVISGRLDKVCPLNSGEELAGMIAGAEHHFLEQAGHFIPLFHETALGPRLRQHLSSVSLS